MENIFSDPKYITCWFDIHDIEHIKALRYLNTEGHWPKGFIPQNIKFPAGWLNIIRIKITEAWIDKIIPVK